MLKAAFQPQVLFGIQEYAEFIECERLFGSLGKRGITKLACWFLRSSYRALPEHSARIVHAGAVWLDSQGDCHRTPAELDTLRPINSSTVKSSGRRTPGKWKRFAIELINLLHYMIRVRARVRAMTQRLRALRPERVVVGQDPVGTDVSFLCHAAKRLGIPVVMVPYALFNTEEFVEYASRRVEHDSNYSLSNKLVVRRWPHWCAEVGSRKVLRLPGWQILALEYCGLGQERPWAVGAGPVDVVTVESRVQFERYKEMRVSEKRLRTTGAAVHDALEMALDQRETTRTKLRDVVSTAANAPILLCAWPPNIFPWANQRAPEFESYEDLAKAWADVLSEVRDRTGSVIIVKPHPKSLDEELRKARDAGLFVSNDDTASLLAAADLFVTTASSVTAWALAACIPTIDYDCYGTGYHDFEGITGVFSLKRRDEFRCHILGLASDAAQRQKIRTSMAAGAVNWGVLDGRAIERILQTVLNA